MYVQRAAAPSGMSSASIKPPASNASRARRCLLRHAPGARIAWLTPERTPSLPAP